MRDTWEEKDVAREGIEKGSGKGNNDGSGEVLQLLIPTEGKRSISTDSLIPSTSTINVSVRSVSSKSRNQRVFFGYNLITYVTRTL